MSMGVIISAREFLCKHKLCPFGRRSCRLYKCFAVMYIFISAWALALFVLHYRAVARAFRRGTDNEESSHAFFMPIKLYLIKNKTVTEFKLNKLYY